MHIPLNTNKASGNACTHCLSTGSHTSKTQRGSLLVQFGCTVPEDAGYWCGLICEGKTELNTGL